MLSTEAVPSVNSRAPFDGYAWRDTWFAFRSSAFEDIARSWLSEHGFEINEDGRSGGRRTSR